MNTTKIKTYLAITVVFLFISIVKINGQSDMVSKSELLDLKLEIMDSKLKLLDSKLEVWRYSPDEIETIIRQLESQLLENNYNNDYIDYKFYQLDSLIQYGYEPIQNAKNNKIKVDIFRYDTVRVKPYSYVISMSPLNLATGTLQINFEKVLNPGNSIEISTSLTYATQTGFTNIYFKNQSLKYYNEDAMSYMPYNPENIKGYGVSVEYKNYLLADINPKQIAPRGLYVAPTFNYKRAVLYGFDEQINSKTNKWTRYPVVRGLDVFSGGVIIGLKLSILKVLSVDGYIGGILRLSQYDDEDSFTKYKNIKNIDYSGVIPTAGLKIGMLK